MSEPNGGIKEYPKPEVKTSLPLTTKEEGGGKFSRRDFLVETVSALAGASIFVGVSEFRKILASQDGSKHAEEQKKFEEKITRILERIEKYYDIPRSKAEGPLRKLIKQGSDGSVEFKCEDGRKFRFRFKGNYLVVEKLTETRII